ncbi:MAG: hypothetical protein LIO96_12150 [Lachnospiraceae bacterium]|nr:hypothetical protein [Lachnospiraceae bacterium]
MRQTSGNIRRSFGAVQPGDDIIVTKWVGLEGTVRIVQERKEALLHRFPPFMVEEAAGFSRYLSVQPELAAAKKAGAAILELTWGGVFGGLWELAEQAGVGLEINLKRIPVRQETVEICNYYDINPYQLISGGSLLLAARDGYGMTYRLQAAGIPAAVVGKAAVGNDRVVLNGGGRRFLEPPRRDEIEKVL